MSGFCDARRVAVCRAGRTDYDAENVRAAVCDALDLLGGGDPQQAGGPLATIVRPGDTVLIKPNMIRQSHLLNDDWEYVITHGEFVRAVALLVARALQGRGRVVIADGPQTDSDFEAIASLMCLADLARELSYDWSVDVEVLDLREECWIQRDGVTIERRTLCGDPEGYVDFDLGDLSEFRDHDACARLYGADYDVRETRAAHTAGRHAYRLARTALEADVFINLPKMKTHKKTGVTLALKNLVGVHGNRNYLPHFTVGDADHGGDEMPAGGVRGVLEGGLSRMLRERLVRQGGTGGPLLRLLKRLGYRTLGSTEDVVRSGNWQGNDTTWRMVLDLNKLLLYGHGDGSIGGLPTRRYLAIVDGIIAGEGNGPMAPDPRAEGLVVAGYSAVAVDTVSTAVMGFDPARLKVISHAWAVRDLPLVDFGLNQVTCVSNVPEWNGSVEALMSAPHLGFEPHFGWRGAIERPAVRTKAGGG